eukprot:Skav236755  [mRNA]  locus=scaffold2899:196312:197509:- [translate_table: standard]
MVAHPLTLRWRWARRSNHCKLPRAKKDKKDIFNYIVSELGSLECMDEQIRSLMGDMLVNNLTNVGRATEDLLKKLGQKKTLSYQGSSRVEALSSFESSELPAF